MNGTTENSIRGSTLLTKHVSLIIFLGHTVGVVQLAEHQTVDLEVVGSRPITHPSVAEGDAKVGRRPTAVARHRASPWERGFAGWAVRGNRAFVAQLDRAPGFEPVGRRFESCRTRFLKSKTGR